MKVGNATVEAELAIIEGGGQALPGREKVTHLVFWPLKEKVTPEIVFFLSSPIKSLY